MNVAAVGEVFAAIGWLSWVVIVPVSWLLLAAAVTFLLGRSARLFDQEERRLQSHRGAAAIHTQAQVAPHPDVGGRRRILVVDDDPSLRLLLRTTFDAGEFAVEEAASAETAADVARFWRPSVVILDIRLPGTDGIAFCRQLKRDPERSPIVILLTGAENGDVEANDASADGILRKPFSPLELLGLVDRLTGSARQLLVEAPRRDEDQILLYARDLARLVDVERSQRRLLQHAYRETVTALADALEAKDPLTGLHAFRVQRYALELTEAVDGGLLDDPSLEYGFLLHDVGKIGLPDRIVNKPGPLTKDELRIVQRHPVVGAELLAGVALLRGEGLRVVRSHHERWDGAGYPDHLAEAEIPIGARIFAVADALDAMTSDRPYRGAIPWEAAAEEIVAQTGRQFDPGVVAAFARREGRLRELCEVQHAVSGRS
jgi:response regulator RpfG family c-di-GMP phosphodiesterase